MIGTAIFYLNIKGINVLKKILKNKKKYNIIDSINLLDNKYEWLGKFGETINEEDIFFDILHHYYINFELSFDRLTIITGRIRGNSLIENKPSKNIKYF